MGDYPERSKTHGRVNECMCGCVGVDAAEQRRSMRGCIIRCAALKTPSTCKTLPVGGVWAGSEIKSLLIRKCDEMKTESGRTGGLGKGQIPLMMC